MSDVLSQVDLTPKAVQMYQEFVQTLAPILLKHKIKPSEIPEEDAELGPNGTLLVFIDLPRAGRVECSIPATGWKWRERN